MDLDSFFQLPTYSLFVIIFFLIIVCNQLGYRYKKKQIRKHPGEIQESMGSIEGAMLGVTSLLLGFSFSVAVSKYEVRRQLTVEEANHIGTAILQCDLFPDSIRVPLRADFKEYVEVRIAYYEARHDEDLVMQELRKSEVISGRIWKRVAGHSSNPDFRVSILQMVPNLNEMIDIAVTRDAMRITKVPPLILWTLVVFVLSAAFLLGTDYKGNKRNIMLLCGYALVMSMTMNLINELSHPRQGLINLDLVEMKMKDLRNLFE